MSDGAQQVSGADRSWSCSTVLVDEGGETLAELVTSSKCAESGGAHYRRTPAMVAGGDFTRDRKLPYVEVPHHLPAMRYPNWPDVLRGALLELGDRLRTLRDPREMSSVACEIVGRTLGISSAAYGTFTNHDDHISVTGEWAVPGMSVAGDHALRNYGSYIDALRRGDPAVVTDVRADPRTAEKAEALLAMDIRAMINLPIIEEGRLVAVFFVLSVDPRIWTDGELDFVRDVADRTRAAVERRTAEQRLHELAASLQQQVELRTQERDKIWQVSRDMLGVADGSGRWLSVNPAWTATLGWPAEAFVGQTAEWLEHPDDRKLSHAEVAELVQGKRTAAFENRLRTIAGDYRNLSWTAAASEGRIYCVIRDVTEQKARENALAAAHEALCQSQMLAVGRAHGAVGATNIEGEETSDGMPLPVSIQASPVALTTEVACPTGSKGRMVLVVENDPGVAASTIAAVSRLGYRTLLAPDGTMALEQLKADVDSFDIVLADVILTDMSGIELANRIRQHRAGLPVILTSACSAVLGDYEAKGLEIISTPYSIDELASTLIKSTRLPSSTD